MIPESADLPETKQFILLDLAKQNIELNNLEANQTEIHSAQFPKSPRDNSVEQSTNSNPDKMTIVLSEKFVLNSPYGDKKGFPHLCQANLICREENTL